MFIYGDFDPFDLSEEFWGEYLLTDVGLSLEAYSAV